MDKKTVSNKTLKQQSFRLEGMAQHIKSTATLPDLRLPTEVVSKLKEICSQGKQPSRVASRESKPNKGLIVLFTGLSNAGKINAAAVIANELHLNLYHIDLSAVVSKYIGETEKNLARIFDAAEQGSAVLFFDEADALFDKRSEVKDAHDRYANIEVEYLLDRMDEHPGVVILTTNRKDNLDEAFLRRLRFIVNFPPPKRPPRTT